MLDYFRFLDAYPLNNDLEPSLSHLLTCWIKDDEGKKQFFFIKSLHFKKEYYSFCNPFFYLLFSLYLNHCLKASTLLMSWYLSNYEYFLANPKSLFFFSFVFIIHNHDLFPDFYTFNMSFSFYHYFLNHQKIYLIVCYLVDSNLLSSVLLVNQSAYFFMFLSFVHMEHLKKKYRLSDEDGICWESFT